MKNKILMSFLAISALTPALAQDFCAQLGQIQQSQAQCTERVVGINREFRDLQDVIRQNEELISGRRATEERARNLRACEQGNERLRGTISGTEGAVASAMDSVRELTSKKEELSRFVRDNVPSTFECAGVDPKYGNSLAADGQPHVYFASGRTEEEAVNNLRSVAAARGNTRWDRIRKGYRCFEVLNREAAQRFDRDVEQLGQDAQRVEFRGEVIEVEIGPGPGRSGGAQGGRGGGGRG